jgi:hypothetical protein
MPGDVPASPVAALWSDETTEGFRTRWREVQLCFVDDPSGAVHQAQTLTAEVVDAMTTALGKQRDDLDQWRTAGASDTEELRVALRRYRDFLDQVLNR